MKIQNSAIFVKKKNVKINLLEMKNRSKFGIFVIPQVNKEVLYIAHVVSSILYLKEFP